MRDFESRHEARRQRWEERKRKWEARMERHSETDHSHSRVWAGLFLLLIGGLSLAKSFGTPFPPWVFTWQMLLIGIGLFVGFRKGFNSGGWFVPVFIGGIFLLNDYVLDGDLRRHMWPLILIVIGVFFIIKPKRRNRWAAASGIRCDEKKSPGTGSPPPSTPLSEEKNYSEDDFIDATSIFGSTKKVILSKNFRGGDIVNIFGGSEIDLSKADMNTTAELEVTAIFGGASLVVPSHWAVKSEAVTIFGGINDKRSITGFSDSSGKSLVLRGTVLFGGIEIKSY